MVLEEGEDGDDTRGWNVNGELIFPDSESGARSAKDATELKSHTVVHILAYMTVGIGRIYAMPPPSQRIYRRDLRWERFV